MTFKLSKRSLRNLEGVDEGLQRVVHHAISVTKVDFAVICGLRTEAEQRELVRKGASQTMASKHLEGKAVDLMAYIKQGGRFRASWELNLYDEIADSMRAGAEACGVPIRWGCAWHVNDCRATKGMTMEEVMNDYIDLRRSERRRPFLDGPHFEKSSI